jgi:hypothetical protein
MAESNTLAYHDVATTTAVICFIKQAQAHDKQVFVAATNWRPSLMFPRKAGAFTQNVL